MISTCSHRPRLPLVFIKVSKSTNGSLVGQCFCGHSASHSSQSTACSLIFFMNTWCRPDWPQRGHVLMGRYRSMLGMACVKTLPSAHSLLLLSVMRLNISDMNALAFGSSSTSLRAKLSPHPHSVALICARHRIQTSAFLTPL